MKLKFSDELDIQLFIEIQILIIIVAVINIMSNHFLHYPSSLNNKWYMIILLLLIALRDSMNGQRVKTWNFITFVVTIFFLFPSAFFEIGGLNLIILPYAFLLTVIIGFLTNGKLRIFLLISHVSINFTLFLLQVIRPELFPNTILQIVNRDYLIIDILIQLIITLVISSYLTVRFSNVWRNAHQSLQEKNERLEWFSNHDELTKVYNRRFLVSQLQELSSYENPHLIIIDIDDFKQINDKYGHSDGDRVLIHIASLITDAIDDNGFVARFGGDEFIVFLNHSSTKNNEEVLDKLTSVLSNIKIDNIGKVSVSGGHIEIDPEKSYIDNLVEADKLLFWAKKNGKAKIKFLNTNP